MHWYTFQTVFLWKKAKKKKEMIWRENGCARLTCSFFPNNNGRGNALRLTMQGDLAITFDAHVAWFNNPAWRYYNGYFHRAQKPFRMIFIILPVRSSSFLLLLLLLFSFVFIFYFCNLLQLFCGNEFYCGMRSS